MQLLKKSLLLCYFIGVSSFSQKKINFNQDWKFNLGDTKEAKIASYNDVNWRTLDLPHDWSIEGEYDKSNPMSHFGGYLPSGIGWYRKTIKIPREWLNKQVSIMFDGVCMNSTVWVNNEKLGSRPYGWIGFSYDITKYIKQNKTLTFSVRVDNDKQPSARWYTGSGIYANTWIQVKENVHIPNSGIYVRTEGDVVKIDTEIRSVNKTKKIHLRTKVLDTSGKVVGVNEKRIKIAATSSKKITQEIKVDAQPLLWSLKSPNLYRLESEILINSKVVDRVITKFGFRNIEWKPKTGMWLNGKNIKLRGVCNHQDAGALGAAVPDKILRYRIQQMKNMGVNAIRTSHNPQTPQFYDMCDEMGMLVMDEIFDGWMQKAENDYGAHYFKDWWKKDLTSWLKRDRNHPSVVVYSLGNETHGDVAQDLLDVCHNLDPTRPVTSGNSEEELMDIYGANGASEMKGFFDTLKTDRVFIGTENTHTLQVRGYYRTKTWYRNGYPNAKRKPYYYPDLTKEEVFKNDWTTLDKKTNAKQIFLSSYDNATIRLNSRQNVELLRDIPNFAGSFRWTGYDYLGETKYHGGWPFKALSSGAVDIANFEKDLYYMYQSQWTNKPMAHILPHWTHPTIKLGTKIPVWVYSNCEEVELFFNGKSLGKKRTGKKWDKMQCQWLVPWKPGKLKVVAFKEGKPLVEKSISTANSPSKISLSIDGSKLNNIKGDVTQLRVCSLDDKNEFYPYGENRSYFHVIGAGKIRALDNGSPVDVEKHYNTNDRKAFYGLTRAYIESTNNTESVNVLVASILGEKKLLSSNKVSIDTKILNLRGNLVKSNIKIFYTIDGTTPNTNSKLYMKPFTINLGTTVKALVLLDGEKVFCMGERFARDEGFVFDSERDESKTVAGDQAEEASLEGAVIANKGQNFNGKGYVNLSNKSKGVIKWYYENDGGEGEFNFKIRYSALDIKRKKYEIKLIINGENKKVVLPPSSDYLNIWDTVEVSTILKQGANRIIIESNLINEEALSIDEIVVY